MAMLREDIVAQQMAAKAAADLQLEMPDTAPLSADSGPTTLASLQPQVRLIPGCCPVDMSCAFLLVLPLVCDAWFAHTPVCIADNWMY